MRAMLLLAGPALMMASAASAGEQAELACIQKGYTAEQKAEVDSLVGKIDVIGHSAIIVALFALVADDRREEVTVRRLVLAPVSYLAALVLYLGLYYGAHSYLFGSTIL